MESQLQLIYKLQKLKKIFDFDKVLSVNTDEKSVAKYYKINRIPYSLFHSKEFVHMTIRRKGSAGLLEQAVIVDKYINTKTKNVLELGCGRGANSIYLAEKHPNINFTGIDLPSGQLNFAIKDAKDLKNFHPEEGNFHDLSKSPKESFDLVFVVEALCHSDRKEKVLKEVNRVLKKNGFFIVIDAFIDKDKLNPEELMGKNLLEKGMNVPKFEKYKDFIFLLKKNNFNVIYEEDNSLNIMFSAKHFEKIAKIFISLPLFISSAMVKILPPEFTYNAISGYLMPDFLEMRIGKYMVIVTQK